MRKFPLLIKLIAYAIPIGLLIESSAEIVNGFVYRTAKACPVGSYVSSCPVVHLGGRENIDRLSGLIAISLLHFLIAFVALLLLRQLFKSLGRRRKLSEGARDFSQSSRRNAGNVE